MAIDLDTDEELYARNQPEHFWNLPEPVPLVAWQAVQAELRPALSAQSPHGRPIPLPAEPRDLIPFLLGEEMFGPRRYQLSRAKQWYYLLKPLLPRRLMARVRRGYQSAQVRGFPLDWPQEERYARLMYGILRAVAPSAATVEAHRRSLWPDGADFALVLTHDVETAAGRDFVDALATLEERYGFRSSFNFVPERYHVPAALRRRLADRGFEVGVHGLNHDGRLFSSFAEFKQRSDRINRYLEAWGATGFRSPMTHRNPAWLQGLTIDYDLSFFDTDPFEPMPGGTTAIWPFFCGHFVELPYTLLQDHTMLVVLGEKTPSRWIEKVDFLARWGGMALLNSHPDFLRDPAHFAVYEEFLRELAGRRSRAWHALPRDVAAWWRRRANLPPAPLVADRVGVETV
jgi:peptidoglycan/xylan/chitin deacetylase (PgdA/CDA1 family)